MFGEHLAKNLAFVSLEVGLDLSSVLPQLRHVERMPHPVSLPILHGCSHVANGANGRALALL